VIAPGRPKARWGWLEWVMAIAVLVLLGRMLWALGEWGYLPQPFFYEPSDTYMDWFNTVFWAHQPGAYEDWGTLYPPLSFVVLRLLSKASCYAGAEGVLSRDCDWVGIVAIHAIYVINIVLIALTYRKVDCSTAVPRGFALAAGMPMLYALDRGNILLLCFTCMLLAYGPLVHSARLRWLFAGLAMNFKVYLVATIASQLLRRRWLWVEGALIAAIAVYAITYAILGEGTPTELYRNIRAFTEGWEAAALIDIWYPATFKPMISLLGGSFPAAQFIGSDIVEIGLALLPILTMIAQAAIVLAAAATWLRPEVVPRHRVAFLGTAMALVSSEAGGYTHILAIMFVFMERWRGFGRPLAILCCYLLCLPGDITIGEMPPLRAESYLGNSPVEVHFGFGIGMLLRPALLIIATVALSSTTIREVWQDIRIQGWQSRWRYRCDLPILPGVARPDSQEP
jgi:hypothetical protein